MENQQILDQMTLDEKFRFLTGGGLNRSCKLERFPVEVMRFHDSPFGLRLKLAYDEDKREMSEKLRSAFPNSERGDEAVSTAFPTGCAMGAAWDPDIVREIGRALGEEYSGYGINAVLGPALNIKRHPLCGRNFEYFSEDPVLSGELASAYVEGVQSQGVAACPKHYAANNQERGRAFVSSEIDERTLREVYLKPFEILVRKAHPWSIMCAYNRINGVYASEHKQLLNDILRQEWGFDGIVISDWGAVKNRAYSLLASVEMCMPYQEEAYGQLQEAYEQGLIDEGVIDEALTRLFRFYERTKTVYEESSIDFEAHHRVAVQAAREAVTLLKNEKSALPILKGQIKRLLVVGERAARPFIGGDGSSRVVNPAHMTTPLQELTDLLGEEVCVQYVGDDALNTYDNEIGFMETDLAKEAMKADAVVVFANQDYSNSSEAMDRNHIELEPYLEHAIRVCHRVNARVIVVLNVGSAISTYKWEHCADAILVSWFGGQGMGRAVAETICGLNNPSGKLPETFPRRLQDVLSLENYLGDGYKVEYNEKLLVGYRCFDRYEKAPCYEFGFGLSYSSFSYHDLTLEGDTLSFFLTNTSDLDGAEVAQVYVEFPPDSWSSHPVRELKAFRRVWVKARESVRVSIPLPEESFQYYNTALRKWTVESGVYTIRVGASSRILPLSLVKEMRSHELITTCSVGE